MIRNILSRLPRSTQINGRYPSFILQTKANLNSYSTHRLSCDPPCHNSPSYNPLLDQVEYRRQQARRSILVQVAGLGSASDLASYCTDQFGPVSGLHFYHNKKSNPFKDFFIVEFEKSRSVEEVLSKSSHSTNETGGMSVPVYSPFLWLQGSKVVSSPGLCTVPVTVDQPDGERLDLAKLRQISSVSDQIVELWWRSNMTENSTRLRFMVGRQVELALSGMFPRAKVLPFGSSINGFGTSCGDQDMFLVLDPPRDVDHNNRLVFHAKGTVYGGDRAQVQRYCDQVAKIIQCFLPGCQDVQTILGARVPIVKYCHQLAGLECDLSMSSSSGLHMSCLLHLWGETDWRVRPLVSLVRRWAKSQHLVKDVRPTYFFTNFSLTMLVVCYLQQVHQMLPSLDILTSLATDQDTFVCEDMLTVNFLHNIDQKKSQLNQSYDKSISLSQLLLGFFQFYSNFDFSDRCLCPVTGTTRPKDKLWSNSSSMDIVNPLEPNLNISYNINRNAVNMFQEKAIEATERLTFVETAQERGELLNSGIFWLFESSKKSASTFALPSIKDLGLNHQKELHKQNVLEKSTRDVKNIKLKMDINKEQKKGQGGVSDKIRVKHFFNSNPSQKKEIVKETIPNEDNLQREKYKDIKYLRIKVGPKFSHKL